MPVDGTVTTIDHDPVAGRFFTDREGCRAVLDYTLVGDIMTIVYTGVPAPIAGRGLAADLMRAALATARGAGWTVIPACSYAAAFIRRHPEQMVR